MGSQKGVSDRILSRQGVEAGDSNLYTVSGANMGTQDVRLDVEGGRGDGSETGQHTDECCRLNRTQVPEVCLVSKRVVLDRRRVVEDWRHTRPVELSHLFWAQLS